jgi:hypothetical protein
MDTERMRKMRDIDILNCSRVKPEGKKPLAGSRCRWEDTIKIDLG